MLAIAALLGAGVPGAIDTLVRRLLRRRAACPQEMSARVRAAIALIPARSDAARTGETLASLAAAARTASIPVRIIVLLDGDDTETRTAALTAGAIVLVKTPAGPRKGDALRWLVREHSGMLDDDDIILLLDAGTRVRPDFFEHLRWHDGVAAMQCRIVSEGSGIARAIASSEETALREDEDRVAAGWNPRLRGSGLLATGRFFKSVVPRLRTQIEDWEMSLLAGAEGWRIVLAPAGCEIIDRKPETSAAAARQRARWLAGQIEMVREQRGEILRFIARDPAQGIAFTAELLSRPRSLVLPLRLASAAAAAVLARRTPVALISALVLLLLTMVDAAESMRAPARGSLLNAWLRALRLLPDAGKRWLRADDR